MVLFLACGRRRLLVEIPPSSNQRDNFYILISCKQSNFVATLRRNSSRTRALIGCQDAGQMTFFQFILWVFPFLPCTVNPFRIHIGGIIRIKRDSLETFSGRLTWKLRLRWTTDVFHNLNVFYPPLSLFTTLSLILTPPLSVPLFQSIYPSIYLSVYLPIYPSPPKVLVDVSVGLNGFAQFHFC